MGLGPTLMTAHCFAQQAPKGCPATAAGPLSGRRSSGRATLAHRAGEGALEGEEQVLVAPVGEPQPATCHWGQELCPQQGREGPWSSLH